MADVSVDQTSGTLNPTDEPAHYIWEVPEYPEVNRMDGVKRCYVTEIRITNFKSYNGEHVVPLTIPTRPMNTQSSSDDRGDEQAEEDRVPLTLTGVIGPNGSGKSNLLDAVCFCLCVGARRLRNDRLKSLLNTNAITEANGDSSASVSLTVRIEKESGDAETGRNLCDTTFTRSITMKPDDHARRDVGEEEGGHDDDDTLARGSVVGSVYRVNDEICTQTQYKAELLKHHLDADASFFLVLQGQIDRLLSKDDAMSITKAIEAASGSWRYRKDYDIVAKKKEHAEDAVARLIAKRRQINQELNALAAQVQEADRYKDRKAELEKKQRDKLTYSLYEIEKEADALLESSEGLLESYEEAKAAVQEAQRQQSAAGEERKAIAEEHDRLQMSLERERRKREETEVTMAELRGKKKQLTASEVEVAGRIDTTRKSLRDQEDRLGDVDDRIVEVKAALEALTIRRGKVDDEIGGGVLTEEIVEECGQIEERAQGVAASIENSIDACKEQQVLLSQCIDEAKATITRLEETKALRQREVDDAGTGMDALRERLHARELAVAEERRERVERREARRVVEERLEKTRRERQAVADELSLMRAGHRESERAATLRANVDRLIKEGPLEGARDGTSLDGRGKGYLILGLVSDLVRPSHKKYSQAIRAAIGRQHLEAVVVGTRKDALACIRWLKEKKIPPMTFIPIEDIDLPGLLLSNEDIPSNSGLRRAEDCVKAVNRVPSHLERVGASQRGIVELIDKLHRWLLGRSVVADTLAQARSVLSRSGRRKSAVMSSGVKAVTLDGDTIARNGNMTNGQGTVRGNTGDLWDAQQIASLKAELTQKDGDIVRIEKELEEFSDIKGDVGEAVDGDDDDRPKDLQTEVLRLEIETLEKDRRVAEEEIARLEARIEEIRHSLTDLDTQREETTNRMRDLQQELSDKTKNFYEDINKRVFGEDAADSDQDVMSLIRDRKELIDTIDREMCRLEQQKDMLEGKREGLIEDLDRWRSNLASQESSLKELRRGLEELLNEEEEVRTEHGARGQTDGETVKELEAALEEAIARRDEASNRFDVAVQQLKASIDRCNEVRVVVTKEEHRLQQLRYHHMQLVRSILSQPREQQQQQHQHSILSTQVEEEDKLPFENASEVLPALKRILFERGCSDDEEDEGTQDILDEYDALELKVDQGIVGRILSEASSRRGARAGGKEVMAVLEDEIERLQEIITHLKPNLRAYDRNEEMRRALTAVTRSLEAARLEATEIGQHFEAVKNARRNRFNECYAFVRERVMTYYRQLTSRVASHRRTTDGGGGTPEDVPLTPGPHGRAAAPTGRGSGQNDAGGSVYLDAENVTEPYLGVVQFSAHPESDRFVDSQLLSGGEKTIAVAALLFSLFAWQRPALILLDEVDAALDKMNLSTLSHFILGHTSQCKDPDGILQVILVSLKESFYAKTQALVGVYKDPLKDDSHLLSLDLRPYNGDAASGEDSTDSYYSQKVTKRTAQHPINDSPLDSTNHRRMGG